MTTVEGASGPVIDAIRDAWYRGNVVQCGYCQPGQTLAAAALLAENPSPDDAAIGQWMNGNLCRCGTYPRIRHAITQAAQTLAATSAGGGDACFNGDLLRPWRNPRKREDSPFTIQADIGVQDLLEAVLSLRRNNSQVAEGNGGNEVLGIP